MSRIETIGDCTLYLGDCLEILPTLGNVDAVVTDPPFGMNYRSNHNSGRSGAGAKMARKDGDFAPIAGDNRPFDPSPWLHYREVILWGANHFCASLASGNAWLIWNKVAGKASLPSGSDVELAWTNWRGPSRIYEHLWRGIMRAGEENIVHAPKQHPNQKPAALMTWCLEQIEGQTILDPYMGSGTTGISCLRTGRAFVGIEIDPAHFETACRRIAEEHTRPRLFAEPKPEPKQEVMFP